MEASQSKVVVPVLDLSGLAKAADILRSTGESGHNPMSSAQRALEGNKLSRVVYMALRQLEFFPGNKNPFEGKELPRDRAKAGELILNAMLPAARTVVQDAISEYYGDLLDKSKKPRLVKGSENIKQYMLEAVVSFPVINSSLDLAQAEMALKYRNSTKPERGQTELIRAQIKLGLPVNIFTIFPFDVEASDPCGQLAVGIACRAYKRLFYYHLVSDFMQSAGFIENHEGIAEKLMPPKIKARTEDWHYAENLFDKCRKVHKLAIVLSEMEIRGDKATPYLLDYISKQCPGLDNFLKRNKLKQSALAKNEEKVISFDEHRHAQKQALHEKLLKHDAYRALGADEQHKIIRQLIHVTATALTEEVLNDLFGNVIDPQRISAFARDPSGENRKIEEKNLKSGQKVVFEGENFQVDSSRLQQQLASTLMTVFESVPLSHRTALIGAKAVTDHRKGIYSYQDGGTVVFFRFDGTEIKLLLAGKKSEMQTLAVQARGM